jgi:hypothetical protein
LEYNTGRDSIDVKLCRIGNEEYMKIEYFVSHKDDKNRNKFLKNDIDSLKIFECFQKNVSIKK